MSNRWTRRRLVIKRPIVCKSPPTPEEAGPQTMHLDMTWVQNNPPGNFNNLALIDALLTRTPNTNLYPIAGTNIEGDGYTGSLVWAAAPADMSMLLTMTTGPYAGETISGTSPGDDGSRPLFSNGILTATGPSFIGNYLAKIP